MLFLWHKDVTIAFAFPVLDFTGVSKVPIARMEHKREEPRTALAYLRHVHDKISATGSVPSQLD